MVEFFGLGGSKRDKRKKFCIKKERVPVGSALFGLDLFIRMFRLYA